MRLALLAVVAAALAVGAALPAQAQGTFPLKYQDAAESDALVWSHAYHGGSAAPPVFLGPFKIEAKPFALRVPLVLKPAEPGVPWPAGVRSPVDGP